MAETTMQDLQAEVDRLGLTVTGTGKDGNVLKADLEAALEAHAASGATDPGDTSGRPDLVSVAEKRASNEIRRTVGAREEA